MFSPDFASPVFGSLEIIEKSNPAAVLAFTNSGKYVAEFIVAIDAKSIAIIALKRATKNHQLPFIECRISIFWKRFSKISSIPDANSFICPGLVVLLVNKL